MQNWNHSPEELPVNGSPSSSVDPFLLDFGTSVNVTEDLRREIRTEIQEIDKKIQTGLNENKQEQRLAGQLQQDLSHAQCEMRNLSRGAADRLDDAGVHASFLNGLETSLHTDLVTSTGPLPGCRSPVSVLSAGDARSMPPTSGTSKKATKKKTNKQVLGEKREIVKKLVQSFQEQSKIGETRRREKETLLQQKQQIEDTIRTGGLESILEQSKQKNEHSQVDVKNESHRQQHLKEKMQSVRGKCGEHGQKLADKTKEINGARNQNVAEQESFSKQVAEVSMQVSQQKSSLSDAKSCHALMDSRIAQAQQELDEYTNFCKARNAMEGRLGKEEREHQELVLLMEALNKENEGVLKELEESKVSLENAEKLHVEAMQKKAANDENESSMCISGEDELVKLAEEKERLASKIGGQHAEMVHAQAHEKEEVATKRVVRKQVAEKLAALQQKVDAKRTETGVRENAAKDAKEALEREIQENHDLAQKLRLTYEAKMKHIEEMNETNKEESKTKVEEAKDRAQNEIAGQERYLRISVYGAELIENAKDTEQKLSEDPL